MRKKLLLKSTGFEKPGSREEAIMQNILGASNVLEPAESNIEEILQSILYNIPYTKEAEFEIEKILLAIKNNSPYDGDGDSRDMRILIAILNDLDYTEGTESRIEELFVEWLHQRSKANVLEGVPPLTFVAKGNPLINYEISGNSVQSGTPTPDNPIMPQGTGERTGQLFDENYPNMKVDTPTYRSIYVGDGTFTLSTTTVRYGSSANLFFLAGNVGSGASTQNNGIWNGNPRTVTAVDGYVTIAYRYYTDDEASDPKSNDVMLNTGSTPLPYEPYGYKIPISSTSTTTPVYLGEVQTTRKIYKWVLTGNEEGWLYKNGFVYNQSITPNYLRSAAQTVVCSHFKAIPNVTAGENVGEGECALYGVVGVQRLYFRGSNYTTSVSDFKSYLAQQYANGTPVTIWYVLATEETAVVNEPLMKIGDYSDTLSKAQAGVEIPTVNGSNTLDVDTTLKPSNIYIEYK